MVSRLCFSDSSTNKTAGEPSCLSLSGRRDSPRPTQYFLPQHRHPCPKRAQSQGVNVSSESHSAGPSPDGKVCGLSIAEAVALISVTAR
jgi:hypothetical protein